MVIDSHHHFWTYNDEEFGWISDDMRVLRRDFGPRDLQAELAACGVDGAISVQARTSLDETAWLLKQAAQHDFIEGVVGWVPLDAPDCRAALERFAGGAKLCGIREIAQGQPDGFLLRPEFNAGVDVLAELGLAYDILIFERQLPEAITFVDRHPQATFVLDHIAKPRIKDGALHVWANHIRVLAQRPNVFCKVSGMVTEADFGNWTADNLRPYFDAVLEAFGPQRLMFGSDWPVCLLATDYRRWVETVRGWSAPLSSAERASLFGGTAQRAYQLSSAKEENHERI